jgi:hypothetical protein
MRKSLIRLLMTLLTTTAIIASSALPAMAVTAWWSESSMIVEADEAITPADLSGNTPDVFEPDNKMEEAKSLRVGASPQDHVILKGDEDWYVLEGKDGPGYIRVGATGSIIIDDGPYKPGEDFEWGGAHTEYNDDLKGADLIEGSNCAVTGQVSNWNVEKGYMRITTKSTKPIAYRISFVSELPENRIGTIGASIVADNYITSVAYGNLTEIYRSTRKRYTEEQATELRESLFGLRDKIGENGFWLHSKERSVDPNAIEMKPLQHIILSDETSTSEGRHWAFVINCFKEDGLWLVDKAQRDPEMTNDDVAEIVQRDIDAMNSQAMTGAASPKKLVTKSPKKTTQQNHSWLFKNRYILTTFVLLCFVIVSIVAVRSYRKE